MFVYAEFVTFIFGFVLFVLFVEEGSGQDVEFKYLNCYSDTNRSITMQATYTGPGTVTAAQWYYSGKNETGNLVVSAGSCTIAGTVPQGYPDASNMQFECPATNTFKLKVNNLQDEEIQNEWGAVLTVSSGTDPDLVHGQLPICSDDDPHYDRIIPSVVVVACFIIGIIIGIVVLIPCKHEIGEKASDVPIWLWLLCIIVVGLGIILVWLVWEVCGVRNKCCADGPKGDPKSHPMEATRKSKVAGKHVPAGNKNGTQNTEKRSPRPLPTKPSATVTSQDGLSGRYKKRQQLKRKKKRRKRVPESEGAVSRRDVDLQESDKFTRRPMPSIPPGHDAKGRGLSANFDDDDHPMISVGIPNKRAGALDPLHEDKGDQERKKKKKKKNPENMEEDE